MKPFTYVLPKSLAEAGAAGKETDTVLKGAGIDLVDRMKERLQTPARVVNLLPLTADLAGVSAEADGSVRIGALTTLTQLEQHQALAARSLAALRDAAATPATPHVRNRATVDWPTTACAVALVLDGAPGSGTITAARLVLGAVAPVPVPRPDAAKLLVGQKPSAELFQKVADAAFAGAQPLAHNDYKIVVGKAIVRDALEQATRR